MARAPFIGGIVVGGANTIDGSLNVTGALSGASFSTSGALQGNPITASDGTHTVVITPGATNTFNSSVAINFQINGTNVLQVNAAGNINNVFPASGVAFTVTGSPTASATANFIGGTGNNVFLQLTSSSGQAFAFRVSGLAGDAWDLYDYTRAASTLKVDTSGTLTIQGPAATKPALIANGGAITLPITPTFNAGGTTTVDCSRSNVFAFTMTGGNTTLAVSNPTNGQTINVRITQDGTGSRLMTAWPSGFKWPGGTAGVLSTGANAVDLLVATYYSDVPLWLATLVKGLA